MARSQTPKPQGPQVGFGMPTYILIQLRALAVRQKCSLRYLVLKGSGFRLSWPGESMTSSGMPRLNQPAAPNSMPSPRVRLSQRGEQLRKKRFHDLSPYFK